MIEPERQRESERERCAHVLRSTVLYQHSTSTVLCEGDRQTEREGDTVSWRLVVTESTGHKEGVAEADLCIPKIFGNESEKGLDDRQEHVVAMGTSVVIHFCAFPDPQKIYV
jgi:hypothetical protein